MSLKPCREAVFKQDMLEAAFSHKCRSYESFSCTALVNRIFIFWHTVESLLNILDQCSSYPEYKQEQKPDPDWEKLLPEKAAVQSELLCSHEHETGR